MFNLHTTRWQVGGLWTILLLLAMPLAAQDADVQLRLQQSLDLQAETLERRLLADEDYQPAGQPQLIIEGRAYPVGDNVDDLGRALYVALQQRQWSAVVYFLQRYAALDDADPMLLAFAQGSLARVQGDLRGAEAFFRQLLLLQPGFLPGQLELARVLFENHKNPEAYQSFEQIAAQLDPLDERQSGVRRTVQNFLQALDQRHAWQGSVAFGPIWNDNLNQSSGSRTCLLELNGQCYYERKVPDALSATGVDYEFSLNRQFSLSGHHGMYVRALWYGQSYDETREYNESTLNLQSGYRYQDQRHQFRLAPVVELTAQGDKLLHDAWGVHAEWMYHLNPRRVFKLEGSSRQLRYQDDRFDRYNGPSHAVYATVWQVLPNNWTAFAGLDWQYRDAEDETLAYQQPGLRLGMAGALNQHLHTTLLLSHRERRHQAFSAVLGERRSDDEQSVTLILRAPTLQVAGFEPVLTLRHRKIRSNVDWLYSHDRNQVSLKLERRF
ncbi:MAG: surface lipoprotein assembly modifier [Nitrincola lacisaponensis]|uniref:surface lipoprotein assembly modifier n=1 Tax=Nitrincola lacisaponensis TaxID=267850 RepID=UPI0039188302